MARYPRFRPPALVQFSIGLWLLIGLPALARAGDWPHWRGPLRNGTTAESGWQDHWTGDGPPVAWRAKVGLGYSSFVVADGRAFTLGHEGEKDRVVCFDAATGKEVWRHEYPADLGDKYFEGGTTGTPTVDGDRVYSLSRWGDLFCFEAATGKITWSKNIVAETGVRIPDWGFGGAPLVVGDRLILNVGGAGLALDKLKGTLHWKSDDANAGYSTPLPLPGADGLAIFSAGQSYSAVHLDSGKVAWKIRWLTQYGVNAADPIVQENQFFLSSGYGKGGALFELGTGEPKELWKSKTLRTQMNAAVLWKGHLYGVDGDTTEKASLKCLDFATGAEKWAIPNFGSGAVIVADGRLIALNGTGELLIAPADSSAFTPTARAQVLGGKTWTAPVLSNGRIYCRNGRGDVVCLDVRKN